MITTTGICPKCRRRMEQRRHPPGWEPRPGQPFYFSSWDYCAFCPHLQHYEARKVYVRPEPLAVPVRAPAADAIVHMLACAAYAGAPEFGWALMYAKYLPNRK
jgi:hypothetical protein